jgi:coproporphyrinogen III oxidase
VEKKKKKFGVFCEQKTWQEIRRSLWSSIWFDKGTLFGLKPTEESNLFNEFTPHAQWCTIMKQEAKKRPSTSIRKPKRLDSS